MRPHIVVASLAFASILALPIASAAQDRGEPAEFPRWRGTPELTVYFPPAPRMDSAIQGSPAGVRPTSTHSVAPPPRNC
jgi:hypothetical protein